MEIYHDGTNVFGYEVFYEGGYEVGHHLGSMLTPSVTSVSLELEDGDYINSVKVFSENLIDRIELKTAQGKSLVAGSEQ